MIKETKEHIGESRTHVITRPVPSKHVSDALGFLINMHLDTTCIEIASPASI